MGRTVSYAHRSNFLPNLMEMFKYVGATAGNYSRLLKLMEATREDQQALVKGSVADSIRKYAENIAAALHAGDEAVINEFISAIGGTHDTPTDATSPQDFIMSWQIAGGSVLGVVTNYQILAIGAQHYAIALLNHGEYLRMVSDLDYYKPALTYPQEVGLATLMRASAILTGSHFKFNVSIADIIQQTRYEWND